MGPARCMYGGQAVGLVAPPDVSVCVYWRMRTTWPMPAAELFVLT